MKEGTTPSLSHHHVGTLLLHEQRQILVVECRLLLQHPLRGLHLPLEGLQHLGRDARPRGGCRRGGRRRDRVEVAAAAAAIQLLMRRRLADVVGLVVVNGPGPRPVLAQGRRGRHRRSPGWLLVLYRGRYTREGRVSAGFGGLVVLLRGQRLRGCYDGRLLLHRRGLGLGLRIHEARQHGHVALELFLHQAALLGFVGLLMFILGSFRTALSAEAVPEAGSAEIVVPKRLRYLVLKSIVLGAFVHLSWQWINGESVHLDLTERLLPLSGLIFCVMGSKGKIRELDKKVCLAAAVTMMVHLLAAGGFEMPVVMLLLLTTSALGQEKAGISIRRAESGFFARYWMCPGISFSVLTAVIVLRFGLMDVSGVDRYLLLGDDLLHRQGNQREAVVAYRKAAEADLLAVTPRQRLAELAVYLLREESRQLQRITSAAENSGAASDSMAEQKAKAVKSFEKAIEACNFWISVDDRNSFSRALKAECLVIGSQLTSEDELLNEAVELQRQVVAMYPSSVNAWMQLVRSCRRMRSAVSPANSEETLDMATDRVRQLDDINHQWGHTDRYLTDEDRNLLQEASKTPPGASR